MRKTAKKKDRPLELEVTPEQHREEALQGVEPEFLLSPGRHKFRRASKLASLGEATARHAKVRITICLDADILEYFKKLASRPHAAPYQKLINDSLRQCLAREASSGGGDSFASFLRDEKFIEAVARKVSLFILNGKFPRNRVA